MKSELRVIHTEQPEESSAIHEVFFDDDGTPVSFASQPVAMKWTDGTGMVIAKLDEMKQAIIFKEWLSPEDFGLPK